MSGESEPSIETVEKLAAYLKLEIVIRPRKEK
jgi:hypothetical protein